MAVLWPLVLAEIFEVGGLVNVLDNLAKYYWNSNIQGALYRL